MVMAWVASLQAFGTSSSPGHERFSSSGVMPQCWCHGPKNAVIGNSQDGTSGKHRESRFPESAHRPSVLHCDT